MSLYINFFIDECSIMFFIMCVVMTKVDYQVVPLLRWSHY